MASKPSRPVARNLVNSPTHYLGKRLLDKFATLVALGSTIPSPKAARQISRKMLETPVEAKKVGITVKVNKGTYATALSTKAPTRWESCKLGFDRDCVLFRQSRRDVRTTTRGAKTPQEEARANTPTPTAAPKLGIVLTDCC